MKEAQNEPIVVEQTMNAPVERVWKAITDKDEMAKWYFNISAFVPLVGFDFQFTAKNENIQYVHHCRITEIIPNKKLAYTWRYDGYHGNSLVTFELSSNSSGQTSVKLSHEGVETFPGDVYPDFAPESFTAGWTHIIKTSLKDYVEKG